MIRGKVHGLVHLEISRKAGFVAFTVRSHGFTAQQMSKREWWQWADPIQPAFQLFGWIVRLIRPAPTPKYWQRFGAWCRRWNGLTTPATEIDMKRGFRIARPRPEWLKKEKQTP